VANSVTLFNSSMFAIRGKTILPRLQTLSGLFERYSKPISCNMLVKAYSLCFHKDETISSPHRCELIVRS
jgi:hypothetical protein